MTGFTKRIMKKLSYMSELHELTKSLEFLIDIQEMENEKQKYNHFFLRFNLIIPM